MKTHWKHFIGNLFDYIIQEKGIDTNHDFSEYDFSPYTDKRWYKNSAPLSSNPDAWIDIVEFNTGLMKDLPADIQENVREHVTKECLLYEETMNAQ